MSIVDVPDDSTRLFPSSNLKVSGYDTNITFADLFNKVQDQSMYSSMTYSLLCPLEQICAVSAPVAQVLKSLLLPSGTYSPENTSPHVLHFIISIGILFSHLLVLHCLYCIIEARGIIVIQSPCCDGECDNGTTTRTFIQKYKNRAHQRPGRSPLDPAELLTLVGVTLKPTQTRECLHNL